MRSHHLLHPDFRLIVSDMPELMLFDRLLPDVRRQMARSEPALTSPQAPLVLHADLTGSCKTPEPHLSIAAPHVRSSSAAAHAWWQHDLRFRQTAGRSLPTLCEALDAVGIAVEYPLAPEHPFPEPEKDCYNALAWAVVHAEELGIDPGRIIVLGDSAGGGLAAALSIMARDCAEFAIVGQALYYPMLDHRTGGPDVPPGNSTAGEFVWTASNNLFAWEKLKGSYRIDDDRAAWFSPSLLQEFSGFPKTLMLVGSLDLFVDENLEFARKLVAAGVPTELHLYPDAAHGFEALPTTSVPMRAEGDLIVGIAHMLGSCPSTLSSQ
ncbi:alpha/beta hydrolase [Sphingomonas sp. AP4-R1]|uniref:alpha/beta hydrolase n=1 Tax=Sphingomonas sp. AP4-R1 TaxID=2735134 RepID=UPI001493A987|nr:alpha/beta hydrolase [Sphingomonas sp. AP4-R1]QJU58148.1 alpha/beta hydrolase [Sphingomonas sp. AP4-R1]